MKLLYAVGYFSSPFKKSIIMTMDGGGNDGGLGFWIGEDNKVKKLKPKVMDPLTNLDCFKKILE